MPLYEYYCRACNEKFSQLRPISAAADPRSRCDAGHTAMKVITLPGTIAIAGKGGMEAEEPVATGGGCPCGRGACGCGSLN